MPDKKIKDLAGKRDKVIKTLIDKLENSVKESQRDLLKIVLTDFVDTLEIDDAGNIKNTIGNKRRIATFDQVFNKFASTKGLDVVRGIADGVGRVVDFNQEYFSAFESAAILAPIQSQVKETIGAWLGVSPRGKVAENGYLSTLIKSEAVRNEIKNMALKSIVSQSGYNDLKKTLSEHIEGNKEKTGALERYYRNFAYDTYSVVDRTAGKITADKLKFNYAIYEGGLIETSREFCEEHNGNVYSRDEIKDMMPEKATPPNYDPFTDMGGYGCRHHWNWVPDALAFALRPELKTKEKPPTPINKPAEQIPPPKAEPPVPELKPPTPGNFRTIEEGKEITANLLRTLSPGLNIRGVEVHKDLPLEMFNKYTAQIENLTADYTVFPGYSPRSTPVLRFASTSKTYGSVSSYYEGRGIEAINFGHTTDTGKSRTYEKGQHAIRGKSRVDADKVHIATVTHEFAHVISTSRQAKAYGQFPEIPEIKDFWKELDKLRRAYKKEFSVLSSNYLTKLRAGEPKDHILEEMGAIHLGDYANTNANEFMAEAFTEYKLSSNPSPYAIKVGKLIDKYFKRKK